jgi:hypothetical protein
MAREYLSLSGESSEGKSATWSKVAHFSDVRRPDGL